MRGGRLTWVVDGAVIVDASNGGMVSESTMVLKANCSRENWQASTGG